MNEGSPATSSSYGSNRFNVDQVNLLSYGQDLLAELASHIILGHQEHLPDLTNVTVLFPSSQNSTPFRKYLLDETGKLGCSALLGPEIDTLSNWIKRSFPNEHRVITEQQRELMLVEALVKHPYLYGKASPWSLADSLLDLFDELSERDVRLPETFDDFLKQVNTAYQDKNDDLVPDSDELVGEARLVHTLWQAWQQQMLADDIVDQHTSYLLKLKQSELQQQPGKFIYLAGFSQFSPAEINWLKTFLSKGKTSLWLQCSRPPDNEVEYHPDVWINRLLESMGIKPEYPEPGSDYSRCMDNVYGAADLAMKERANSQAKNCPVSPVSSRLSLFEARSAEQEAMAIDLQARQWCLEGKKKIGIITENRRLARRVRALLERANIDLQDAAGWALSTTSAAATLERWLETVEEDYAYQPLLDLLKSPFFHPGNRWQDKNHDDLLTTVHLFEQGVVLKENITRGIDRYRKHARYRQNRLEENLAAGYQDIFPLLDLLEEAATPLLSFTGGKNFSPSKILDALNESLALLGLDVSFSLDDAGRKILEELNHMRAASGDSSLKMDWKDFRNWLGRTLERFNFHPNIQTGRVQLMSMQQCPLYKFDALIIAGAEKEYLPGGYNTSPFFNDGVRQALGLNSHIDRLSHRFYQFRRLLESSDEIVITRRIEHDDEYVVCSPWVERIKSFHTLAYHHELVNESLTSIVGHPDTIVTDRNFQLPAPVTANPGISVNADLLPEQISASAYQQIMDCPYQFFAARCLKLEPLESIKEMLEKSDYGERVHLCLQAFHSGARDLPGPFGKTLTSSNRDEAIDFLKSLANTVFAKDLEDNFLHRAWLKRWHELIPAYIDWQISRQVSWNVESTELDVTTKLEGTNISLKGRIDRIDINKDSEEKKYNILDYKTGQVARVDDVLSGESIQLPFYVLLAREKFHISASRAEYVSINEGKVQTKTTLEGDDLDELTSHVEQRLKAIMSELENGKLMKAWGDVSACDWCQMSGVCRRDSWQVESSLKEK